MRRKLTRINSSNFLNNEINQAKNPMRFVYKQNSPKNNSVLQEVASDLEGKPVDLNQVNSLNT